MPGVLTTGSSVICGHGGTVSTTGVPKLKVAGNQVLQKTGIMGQSISGCNTPTVVPPPPPPSSPCLVVASVITGEAIKLKVSGSPVMLETVTGTTSGVVAGVTPQTLLSATAGQTKLTAV
jgi:hypothetical protein